jgi:hypothetical protein
MGVDQNANTATTAAMKMIARRLDDDELRWALLPTRHCQSSNSG